MMINLSHGGDYPDDLCVIIGGDERDVLTRALGRPATRN